MSVSTAVYLDIDAKYDNFKILDISISIFLDRYMIKMFIADISYL